MKRKYLYSAVLAILLFSLNLRTIVRSIEGTLGQINILHILLELLMPVILFAMAITFIRNRETLRKPFIASVIQLGTGIAIMALAFFAELIMENSSLYNGDRPLLGKVSGHIVTFSFACGIMLAFFGVILLISTIAVKIIRTVKK